MFTRLQYATAEDLPQDLATLPDIDQRIQAASDIVGWLTSNARYRVDETGYPEDKDLLALFKEATITQVTFADDKYGGVDFDDESAPSQLGSLKFSGEGSTSGRNPNYGTGIRQNVSPAVWYMLRNAGLIRGDVL